LASFNLYAETRFNKQDFGAHAPMFRQNTSTLYYEGKKVRKNGEGKTKAMKIAINKENRRNRMN
jgi:hypothetical protein